MKERQKERKTDGYIKKKARKIEIDYKERKKLKRGIDRYKKRERDKEKKERK